MLKQWLQGIHISYSFTFHTLRIILSNVLYIGLDNVLTGALVGVLLLLLLSVVVIGVGGVVGVVGAVVRNITSKVFFSR